MSVNDGGPAFPEPDCIGSDGTWVNKSKPGMSLRDYFAAKAMAVIYSSWDDADEDSGFPWEEIAPAAYRLADAMLTERAKAKP